MARCPEPCGGTTKARTVSIPFTKEELWELMNNFDKSFEAGDPDNAMADSIAERLHDAYQRMKR